jgi:CelD/BcsL family acetyltransferase involved in cellulose biosynthesis
MNWAAKVYAYQVGRRTDLPKKLRPGAVLLAHAIRQAMDSGYKEFDLLAEAAPYKLQFTSQTRSLVRLRVARPSLVEKLRLAGKSVPAGVRWLRGR